MRIMNNMANHMNNRTVSCLCCRKVRNIGNHTQHLNPPDLKIRKEWLISCLECRGVYHQNGFHLHTKTCNDHDKERRYWEHYLDSKRYSKRKDKDGNRILCHLTVDDCKQLAQEAGITYKDLGRGHYEMGNVRFIWGIDNKIESLVEIRKSLTAGKEGHK